MAARNVLGEPLAPCCADPPTGFYRTGLCAARWREALGAGAAPPVLLAATHERALDHVTLAELKRHALDLV